MNLHREPDWDCPFVKPLLRLAEGEIGFESEFDKGSLFWAVLPCQFESVNSEPTSSTSEQ